MTNSSSAWRQPTSGIAGREPLTTWLREGSPAFCRTYVSPFVRAVESSTSARKVVSDRLDRMVRWIKAVPGMAPVVGATLLLCGCGLRPSSARAASSTSAPSTTLPAGTPSPTLPSYGASRPTLHHDVGLLAWIFVALFVVSVFLYRRWLRHGPIGCLFSVACMLLSVAGIAAFLILYVLTGIK